MLWEIPEIVNGSISPVNGRRKRHGAWAAVLSLPAGLSSALVFFEHVFNCGFVNHQIRCAIFADYLDAGFVIPFDNAVYFLAIAQHDHHGSPRLHLLLIIKILGIGLLRRRRLAPATTRASPVATVVPSIRSPIRAPLRTLVPVPAFRHLLMVGVMVRVVVAVVVIHAWQRRTDQLAIGKVFVVG